MSVCSNVCSTSPRCQQSGSSSSHLNVPHRSPRTPRSSIVCRGFLPQWLEGVFGKQPLAAVAQEKDDAGVIAAEPSPEATKRAIPTKKPKVSSARRRPDMPSPSVQAITHVQVSDDLMILMDVKRRRMIYVCESSGAEKVAKLLRLSGSKLVWIVSEAAKEHAGLAQSLMNAMPCSAWEINVSEESFHPAQLAMLQAQIAPGPSDGLTMPLQRLMRQQDTADTPMGRMRRPIEDPLTFGYMRELRARGKRPRKLGHSHTDGRKRYSHMKALMLQPHMAPLTDGLMIARNRDLEVVWHNLTNFRLGPRMGQAGRVLGFLDPFPEHVVESLGDEDFQGTEVVMEGEELLEDTSSSSSSQRDSSPQPRFSWDSGAGTHQLPGQGSSAAGFLRGADDDASPSVSRSSSPVPDPSAPYMSEWSEVQRELYMAVVQQHARPGAEGEAAGVSSSHDSDDEAQQGRQLGSSSEEDDDDEESWSREEFDERLAAYSAKDELSDDELSELMLNHRELLEQGLVPDSMSTGTLTVTTNADGQGIIITHDAQGNGGAEADEHGAGEDIPRGHHDDDEFRTAGDFNCQMQLSNDPMDMAILIRVTPEAAGGKDGKAAGSGAAAGGAGGRALLERCFQSEESDYMGNMIRLEEMWSSSLHPGNPGQGWGLDQDWQEANRRTTTTGRAKHAQQADSPDAASPQQGEEEELPPLVRPTHPAPTASPRSDDGASTSTSAQASSDAQPDVVAPPQPPPRHLDRSPPLEREHHAPVRSHHRNRGRSSSASNKGSPTSKTSKAQDAKTLARDLLGRDVTAHEAEELAAALQQAASMFELPEVQAAEAASTAAAAAAAAEVRPQPATASSDQPPLQPPQQVANDASGQPPPPPQATASTEAKDDGSVGTAGAAGGTGSRAAAGPTGADEAGALAGGENASEVESGHAASQAAAAVGGPRVTVDDLVSALREKMNVAFGLPRTSTGRKGHSGGRGARRAYAQAERPRPPRRRIALPGSSARARKVQTVSRLRGVVEGWAAWKAQHGEEEEQDQQSAGGRPWGAWGSRADGGSSGAEQPQRGMTYLQAARTVARLMELLHRPCDGATNFAGQDVIVVLPGRKTPLPGSPVDIPTVKLLVTDEGVVEYQAQADALSAIQALAWGGGQAEEQEAILPLGQVIQEIAATWSSWEQELCAPGVKAAGMSANKFVGNK